MNMILTTFLVLVNLLTPEINIAPITLFVFVISLYQAGKDLRARLESIERPGSHQYCVIYKFW